MTPSIEMTDEVLRAHAEKAQVIIVGMNDTEEATVLSARELRMASRSTHPMGESAQQEMTDEQRRTAADAAKERMQPAVMDCYLLNLMPAITAFDEHHTDGTTKRYLNSEMLTRAEYESRFEEAANMRAMWATARETADDPMTDVSSAERKEAAKADLVHIKKYLKNKMGAEAAKHRWTDEEVREKTFSIKTIRVRLSWIVKGNAGGEEAEGSDEDDGDGEGGREEAPFDEDAGGSDVRAKVKPSKRKQPAEPAKETSAKPRKQKQKGKQRERSIEEAQVDEDAVGREEVHLDENAGEGGREEAPFYEGAGGADEPADGGLQADRDVDVERASGLSAEALDKFVLDYLTNLNHFDGINHTEALQRDPGNSSLATWDDWKGTWSEWTVALDDGKPNEERMSAAAADLGNIDQGLAVAARISDRAERVAKLKVLTRTKNKLARIVAGTAGFTDLSRGEFRIQGCKRLIVDGVQGQVKYTCIPDSLVVVARYIGCAVDKALLYQTLVEPQKEVEISRVVNYAREILKIKMICVSHGSNAALARQKGGMEFATLQLDRGAFIIVMNAILEDDTVERHALAFLANFTHPAYRYHVGVLVDNDPRVNVRFLQPTDRATPSSARTVFSGLFWTAKRVSITSVWQVSMP